MEAPTTDPNLCLSTAILGRESQSISTQWSLPFGDECSRIEAVCEEVHYFKQAGHPQRFRNAILEAQDSITSPTTTDVGDMWLSPMKTQ